MKGVVFTKFMAMVKDRFSPEIAERLIEESNLTSFDFLPQVESYVHLEVKKLYPDTEEMSDREGDSLESLHRSRERGDWP